MRSIFDATASIRGITRESGSLRQVAQAIHEGLVVQSESGTVVFANDVAKQILGPSFGCFFSVNPSSLPCIQEGGAPYSVANHPPKQAAITGLPQTGIVMGVLRGVDQVGWIIVNSVPLVREGDEGAHAVVTTLFDVTELREYQRRVDDKIQMLNAAHAELEARQLELLKANEALRSLAETDGLTGVKNKRHFMERLRIEIAAATRYDYPLSVVMLDLDRFKQFNDQYGHLEGDQVLRKLGDILIRMSRQGDLAARYGGEEFSLILPHLDASDSRSMAERLRAEIENEAWPCEAKVTASIGIATFDRAGLTPEHLLAEADRAMYAAKAAGRNRVVHAEDLAKSFRLPA